MYACYWTIYSLSMRYFGFTVQFHKQLHTLSPCEQSFISSFSIWTALPLMQWFQAQLWLQSTQPHIKVRLLKFTSIIKPNKQIAASKSNEKQTNCMKIYWKNKLTQHYCDNNEYLLIHILSEAATRAQKQQQTIQQIQHPTDGSQTHTHTHTPGQTAHMTPFTPTLQYCLIRLR